MAQPTKQSTKNDGTTTTVVTVTLPGAPLAAGQSNTHKKSTSHGGTVAGSVEVTVQLPGYTPVAGSQ